MTTQHTNDEILDTITEYRRRHLTLDELQSAIEAHLGMTLERAGFTGDERYSSGKLVAKSPTGIVLFSIMVYESEGRGWQVGGQGDFLDESRDVLYGLHQELAQRRCLAPSSAGSSPLQPGPENSAYRGIDVLHRVRSPDSKPSRKRPPIGTNPASIRRRGSPRSSVMLSVSPVSGSASLS